MGIKFAKKKFMDRLEDNLSNDFMRAAMVKAQNLINKNRTNVYEELGNFEEWRTLAGDMRQHTLENLDYYLNQFSENVVKNGGKVFFAATAEEASKYITEVAKANNVKKVVKAKSMVTEEISLNHAFEDIGVNVMETDLAEYILQLDDWDPPSHMVVPSLHKNREQIREIFQKKGYKGSDKPEELAQFSREILRNEYLTADMGVSGCNFGIAESGSVTLVTNEGNADLCMSIPKIQVVVMGMERIAPTFEEVDILVSLLTRSSVGAKMTSYVTFLNGVTENEAVDGAKDFHIVIVDNGRSKILASPFKTSLRCIRCAACLNICPVYRHIGGHTYGSIYSGPIGSVISPILGGYDDFKELPYATSLCGACTEVCPVRIPLHNLLLIHRQIIVEEERLSPKAERLIMKGFTAWTTKPRLYKSSTKLAPIATIPFMTEGEITRGVSFLKKWTNTRNLTGMEKVRFRDWYKKRQKEGKK
ncbi:MAG: iron-sulfur protein [Bacillales bacterium]|nr:iron-sulfur protein [Bacillales bacterium]